MKDKPQHPYVLMCTAIRTFSPLGSFATMVCAGTDSEHFKLFPMFMQPFIIPVAVANDPC